MKIDKILLNKDNRMLRIGVGKHDGNWFFRVDFWFYGFRLTKKISKEPELPRDIRMELMDTWNYYFNEGDEVRFHPELDEFYIFIGYEKIKTKDYGVGIVLKCTAEMHCIHGILSYCDVDFNGKIIQCMSGYLVKNIGNETIK